MEKPFNEMLKNIRLQRKMSQSDLAKKTGLTPSNISHYERGTRQPTVDNLRKLCDALPCSSDALLGRGREFQINKDYYNLISVINKFKDLAKDVEGSSFIK